MVARQAVGPRGRANAGKTVTIGITDTKLVFTCGDGLTPFIAPTICPPETSEPTRLATAATYDRAVLDLEFLADRGVTFPVLDAEHTIAAEPAWNGWIEGGTPSTLIAVSVARGIDPSDPDVKVTENDTGMAVWSFDPNRLEGDPRWPAFHASLFLGLQFAQRRGVAVREGTREMYEIVYQAGHPIDIVVDGQVVVGKLHEFPPVGSVVSAVSPTLAVAAAFFLAPSTTAFHFLAP
jgi:hypothetical protein